MTGTTGAPASSLDGESARTPASPSSRRNTITIRRIRTVRASARIRSIVARFERALTPRRRRFLLWATLPRCQVARANVNPVSLDIRPAERVDDELVDAFAELIPQLSSSSPPPTAESLQAIVDSPDTILYIARVDDEIVGSLTLAFYRIPTGVKAWIEDVVVGAAARGHGVGEALNRAAIAEAGHRGAKNVSLTSRSSREAANRLYQRLGFAEYDTNLYRYAI